MQDQVAYERNAQLIEGARMAQQEGRTTRPIMTVVSRSKGALPRATPAVKKPAAPSGHEAFLKGLEASRASIRANAANGKFIYEGRVKHSDRFSISLEVHRVGLIQVTGVEFSDVTPPTTLVLFKHALASFEPLQRRADTTDEE